ncbi:Glycine rich protein [Spatholobus suberectus]|nr:Glycine rich protein [Spatholobus suberectus]
MGSKALLVLVMLLASVLLLSAEVASNDVDEKFDKNDGNLDKNGVDDMKYYGGLGAEVGVEGIIVPLVVVVGTTMEAVGGVAIILVNMLTLVLLMNLSTKHELCAKV